MADRVGKKRQSSGKPMCKYGLSCYRKNPEHQQQFQHPTPLPANGDNTEIAQEISPKKKRNLKNGDGKLESENFLVVTEQSQSPSPVRGENEKKHSFSTDPALHIKELFLVEMPPDFFHFWEFCSSYDANEPSEAFADIGLHLVGPYDVLSKKISGEDVASDDILRHWRYYYDPPEFQTVIKCDGDDCYHIGYFRDAPSDPPFAVASNSASTGPKFNPMGDNIFCAINLELGDAIRSASNKNAKKKLKNIQDSLQKFAKEKNYSLSKQTPKTKERAKAVVAKTFHDFGIVVPYDKKRDVGYRPIPGSSAGLKNILSKIVKCRTDEARLQARSGLDEILTDLQFANDECDFGMGLELGLDLFCFGEPCLHQDVLSVLPLAYDLLERPEFGRIVHSHLSDRRKGDDLSIKKT